MGGICSLLLNLQTLFPQKDSIERADLVQAIRQRTSGQQEGRGYSPKTTDILAIRVADGGGLAFFDDPAELFGPQAAWTLRRPYSNGLLR